MKKLLFLFVSVAIIAASCSKEAKLNKRLDGVWDVVSMDGEALTGDNAATLSFSKEDKGSGKVSFTQEGDTMEGTYTLEKDDKITMVFDGETSVWTVDDYSKTDMTITADGSTLVLKKQ
jgi:hypothetical protein